MREFVQGPTDRLDGHTVALGQLPPRRKPLAELESTCRHLLTQVACNLQVGRLRVAEIRHGHNTKAKPFSCTRKAWLSCTQIELVQ